MDLLPLVLRVLASLAAVLGLVWLLSRAARRRGAGAGGFDASRFSVIGRQSLSRSAGVTVLRVGEEALVLGVTDAQVQCLARMPIGAVTTGAAEPPAAPAAPSAPITGPVAAPVAATGGTRADAVRVRRVSLPETRPAQRPSALAGSALSPGTWSAALETLRERTTRR